MNLDDLKKFCADEDDARANLQQPWTRDGYTYATNGHIVVRIPAIASPNVAALMAKTPAAKEWLPVPNTAMPEPVECNWCQGTKKLDGEDCENCGGSGKTENLCGTPIGNATFADRYLAMIQGWEIAPNDSVTAAWIRNGEVIGLLMPMRAQ